MQLRVRIPLAPLHGDSHMWMYVVAIVVLIISFCTSFGILLDELHGTRNTSTRVFFWIGTVFSIFILLVITVVEATNIAEKNIPTLKE